MLHDKDFPETLISHPHKFSKQLYLSIWDSLVIQPRSEGFYMKANYKIATDDILRTMRFAMHEISTTYILVANETTYRFENNGGYIAIVEDGTQAIWHFYAKDEESLKLLLQLTTKIKKLTTKIKVKASVSETVQAFGNKATIEQVLSEII
jgi:monoamine oxidase